MWRGCANEQTTASADQRTNEPTNHLMNQRRREPRYSDLNSFSESYWAWTLCRRSSPSRSVSANVRRLVGRCLTRFSCLALHDSTRGEGGGGMVVGDGFGVYWLCRLLCRLRSVCATPGAFSAPCPAVRHTVVVVMVMVFRASACALLAQHRSGCCGGGRR